MIPEATDSDLNCLNGNFLCGVVEGFYGRPWTTVQRKKLFQRMKTMGMNTYLYAPKDDCKHRMYWRELYSVEEADHLTGLIEAATEQGITFVYAISPGLDITFSSTKDVVLLKKKLEQVSSFGCKCFALLFDDIENEMCEGDKEIFQSFAAAQVSVTNEVFQHLGQCQFLFCPTEYCASRAVPDVANSDYLNTVGSKLLKGIDILWTGPKVVSKKISVKSIEEVAKVFQRPPVIWDNIHANDYDPKRVFLGPYDGRSPDLIPYLRGVLTNPNCEFEANYIAMHTLAQWCKSNASGKTGTLASDSPLRAEIKLETEGGDISDDELPSIFSTYKPRQALSKALDSWYDEMLNENRPTKKIKMPVAPVAVIPPIPIVNTCVGITATTPSTTSTQLPLSSIDINNINELNNLEVTGSSYMQPTMSCVPISSLVDSCGESDVESVGEKGEPMDCLVTPGSTPASSDGVPVPTDIEVLDNESCKCPLETNVDIMQVDSESVTSSSKLGEGALQQSSCVQSDCDKYAITRVDLDLLVDFFYLPFEHGSKALDMLTDFHWLKANCLAVVDGRGKCATPEQITAASQWHQNADKMREKMTAFNTMIDRLCSMPNRAVLYDMFPYIWDMQSVLAVANAFLDWLGGNKQYSDCFTSGDQEPWVFQGGMQAEFQRMLPLESATDLMLPIVPQTPSSKRYTIRPFQVKDQDLVYQVCNRVANQADCSRHAELIPDKLVGGFLMLSTDFCFVIEDPELGIVGYVLSALDTKDLNAKTEMAWIPAMKEKYPILDNHSSLAPSVQEMMRSFHDHETFLPEKLYSEFPSQVQLAMLPECTADDGAMRRALAAITAALKCSGSLGMHVQIHNSDKSSLESYTKLGFFDINTLEHLPDDVRILGRRI